jgi:phage tail sheath protein FI
MTAVSYPGVYVEEIPGGARPIEAAGTSTTAFVGVAEKGPTDRALRVTSWEEFQRHYGGFYPATYLAEGVFSFFNNGGRQCYVVRVAPGDAATAALDLENRAGTDDAVRFSARNAGDWGNYLLLTIGEAGIERGNGFKLTIRRQPAGRPKGDVPENVLDLPALETHDDLVMDPASPNYAVERLERGSELIRMESLVANSNLQAGFHRGGAVASPDPLTLTGTTNRFLISLDDDGYQEVTLAAASGNLTAVAADIQTKVRALTPRKASTLPAAFSAFTCALSGTNRLLLTSGAAGEKSSVRIQDAPANSATGLLQLGEGRGGISEDGLAVRRPAAFTGDLKVVQVGDNTETGIVTGATLGADGNIAGLNATSYKTAFGLLDKKTDFSLLAVPGIGTSQIMDEGMAYCANRPLQDVFYIGEVGIGDNSPSDAESFRKRLTKANSYGALYYPWVMALDPSGRTSGTIQLPPSGYMAGLYGRIDATRGVWKAPAGTEASLNGVVGLETELTDVQQGNLNPISVNCLRRFDLAGVISWGARTITSDPEWKYVPVRRTAIMIRRSIYDGIQWAVFEPNDHRLWASLRVNIGAFMNSLFRAGAFQGEKANDAYFVRCGLGDTMVQDDIDRGQVIVLIGFAPLKPAEFVIVRIQQKAGQQ